MVRRSRMSGDFKLRKVLRTIHQTVDNEVRAAMQDGADKILDSMREFIPKDTGEGAEALTAYVAKSGLDAQIGLRGKKANRRFFYLRFLEYGTKATSMASVQVVEISGRPTRPMAATGTESTLISRPCRHTPG